MTTRTTNYAFATRKYHANYWVKKYKKSNKLAKDITKFTMITWAASGFLVVMELATGIVS